MDSRAVDRRFWEGRRVLITGNTGFQGSWLSLWLAHLGAEVTGFSLPAETRSNLFSAAARPPHATTHFGDIREVDAIRRCVAATQPTVVFHLAAQALQPLSYREPLTTYATNVLGTVHLLEAIRATGSVAAAILVTSDKCYENPPGAPSLAEDAALGGLDPYGSSKAAAEIVIRAYRASFLDKPDHAGCRVASVRPGNVIGGGDWSENRLLPDAIRAAEANAWLAIRNPEGVRPWQHVLEPLAGYILLAERLAGPDGRSYSRPWNLGPAEDDCRPVAYVLEQFGAAWGRPLRWRLAGGNHGSEAQRLRIDSTAALNLLGWRRRLRLDAAIDWTVEWHRRYGKGENPEAIALAQIGRYEAAPDHGQD